MQRRLSAAFANSDSFADSANADSCTANASAAAVIAWRRRSSVAFADSCAANSSDSDNVAGSESANFDSATFTDFANAVDSIACVTAREIAGDSNTCVTAREIAWQSSS